MRAITTQHGALELRFPLAGAGEQKPLIVIARPGVAVLYDVDRDLVGSHALEPWEGEAREVVVSRGALSRAPATAGTRSIIGNLIVRHAGAGALLYVLAVAALSIVVESAAPFALGVSYVHYVLYLAALGRGRGVAFGEFVRDALFFKALSMLVLGVLYIRHLAPLSLPSITLTLAGVALSSWAARTLGFERTYFDVELGVVPAERVARGPYASIPHPMILGAVIALFGAHLSPGLAEAWPWLVPGHVALYLLHLAQEIRPARAPRPRQEPRRSSVR